MKIMTPDKEPKPTNRNEYIAATVETFRESLNQANDDDEKSLSVAVSSYHSEVLAWTDEEYENPFIDYDDLEQLSEIYDENYALRLVRKDEAAAVARMKDELRSSRPGLRP